MALGGPAVAPQPGGVGQNSSSSGDALAEVLKKQTEILQAKKLPRRSTIQVAPQVQWPVLDDDCSDFRSVQEFYEQFEATIDLANDGEGMTDMEPLGPSPGNPKQP